MSADEASLLQKHQEADESLSITPSSSRSSHSGETSTSSMVSAYYLDTSGCKASRKGFGFFKSSSSLSESKNSGGYSYREGTSSAPEVGSRPAFEFRVSDSSLEDHKHRKISSSDTSNKQSPKPSKSSHFSRTKSSSASNSGRVTPNGDHHETTAQRLSRSSSSECVHYKAPVSYSPTRKKSRSIGGKFFHGGSNSEFEISETMSKQYTEHLLAICASAGMVVEPSVLPGLKEVLTRSASMFQVELFSAGEPCAPSSVYFYTPENTRDICVVLSQHGEKILKSLSGCLLSAAPEDFALVCDSVEKFSIKMNGTQKYLLPEVLHTQLLIQKDHIVTQEIHSRFLARDNIANTLELLDGAIRASSKKFAQTMGWMITIVNAVCTDKESKNELWLVAIMRIIKEALLTTCAFAKALVTNKALLSECLSRTKSPVLPSDHIATLLETFLSKTTFSNSDVHFQRTALLILSTYPPRVVWKTWKKVFAKYPSEKVREEKISEKQSYLLVLLKRWKQAPGVTLSPHLKASIATFLHTINVHDNIFPEEESDITLPLFVTVPVYKLKSGYSLYSVITAYSIPEVATQMTIIDRRHYGYMKSCDLVGLWWMKPETELFVFPLITYINHLNSISLFVATMIYVSPDKKETISYFLQLALFLLEQNNFCSPASILGGLTMILGFSKYLPTLPSKIIDQYKVLEDTYNPTRNFAVLRKCQGKNVNASTIPAIGVLLSDLVAIGQADSLVDGELNMDKWSLLSSSLHKFFTPIPSTQPDTFTMMVTDSADLFGSESKAIPSLLSLLQVLPALDRALLESMELD